MFITAKAWFQSGTANNTRLIRRAETQLPEEFVKLFRNNLKRQGRTPMKTGRLRRSVMYQVLGKTANIGWRAPYARAQNEGGHTVPRRVLTKDQYNGGPGLIPAGYYRYSKYTTAGTGPGFAEGAWYATQREMPAKLRELGLTK